MGQYLSFVVSVLVLVRYIIYFVLTTNNNLLQTNSRVPNTRGLLQSVLRQRGLDLRQSTLSSAGVGLFATDKFKVSFPFTLKPLLNPLHNFWAILPLIVLFFRVVQ